MPQGCANAKVRLYLRQPLAPGQTVALDRDRANYLFAVMRLGPGAALRVFDGASGEFAAEVARAGKRDGALTIGAQTRPLQPPPDLWLMFAPIKKARTDFIVEKAAEIRSQYGFSPPYFGEDTDIMQLLSQHDIKVGPQQLSPKLAVDVESHRGRLEAVVEGRPFDVTDEEGVRHYVTFLREAPIEAGVEALLDAAMEGERFEVVGREVYSRLDKTVMADGRYTDAGAKLGTPATRRNWDVVTSVLELASP